MVGTVPRASNSSALDLPPAALAHSCRNIVILMILAHLAKPRMALFLLRGIHFLFLESLLMSRLDETIT